MRALLLVGIVCGWWLAALPGWAAAQPPLSAGRRVVVLVGLAGDLESEKAYADQLGRLLDDFAAPGAAPESLTLLVENPAAVARKLPFPVRVLPNRREAFLSLRGIDPDLVVAWGHGGQQGSQPVLHVPGPRLTPADFLALVAPGSTRSSDWVLYFRGSQSFAQAVGSSARRVLASEGSKTFSFDPVGGPLLLQAIPRAPDLPALAAATAQAVDRWYASRSLVATEEVTLWLDGRPAAPPPLAAAAPAAPRDPPTAAGNPAAAPAAAGPVWSGPPAVDPAAYPDADAVVLRESVQAVIGDRPQLSQEEERYVQILSPEGKRHGDLDLAFSPPEENLTLLACEVRQPDGRVEQVDPDGGEPAPGAGTSSPEEYPAPRQRAFSVPNVVPGATSCTFASGANGSGSRCPGST